jgi:hypothetical protein
VEIERYAPLYPSIRPPHSGFYAAPPALVMVVLGSVSVDLRRTTLSMNVFVAIHDIVVE